MKESTFSITEEFLSSDSQHTVHWQEIIEQYLTAMLSSPMDGTEKAERELLY